MESAPLNEQELGEFCRRRSVFPEQLASWREACNGANGVRQVREDSADDRVLSRIAAALADPGVDACYGDLPYVGKDEPNHVIRHWRAGPYHPSLLARGWMPPHPTFYARRAVYQRLGGFDLDYRIAADYDCMLRFLGAGRVACAYIPEVLVQMRLGGASNRSLRNLLQKSREDYRALRRNRVGGLGTLLLKNLQKLPQFL